MTSKAINYMGMSIVEPQERMRYLVNYGNMIDVDPKQSISRYYRSGTEMLRMAQVYLAEGNHENAFILYMKYLTLFVEKIRSHPDYNSIKTEMKFINKRIKEEVMPTSEKIRVKLLDRYQREYEQFLANKEAERLREMDRDRRNREAAANHSSKTASLIPANLHVQIDPNNQATAPDMGMLDHVVYPNDFPTPGQKSSLLLPSDGADKGDKRTKKREKK